MYFTWMNDTPVGRLLLAGTEDALRIVAFSDSRSSQMKAFPHKLWEQQDSVFTDATEQLRAYFDGRLRKFDLPLAAQGTEFQKSVWKALCDIPYGDTACYRDIAMAIGKPSAARAVGMANGHNPISIIVPCHRIIGASGKLVGYGGGLDRKSTLLKLESKAAPITTGHAAVLA